MAAEVEDNAGSPIELLVWLLLLLLLLPPGKMNALDEEECCAANSSFDAKEDGAGCCCSSGPPEDEDDIVLVLALLILLAEEELGAKATDSIAEGNVVDAAYPGGYDVGRGFIMLVGGSVLPPSSTVQSVFVVLTGMLLG